MRRALSFIGLFLLLLCASVQSGFAWRDTVGSLWPDKPIQIDGRATEWSEYPVVEVGGLSFRARNDATTLYLLIRGANDDGRILLSGNYRQNVAIWFLKADRKSKAWGITLDFGRAHAPEPVMDGGRVQAREITSLSDMGMAPEMVMSAGLEVSTMTFPADFSFQADLSSERGRQPIYEIQIPLTMLEPRGRTIAFDVVSSDVPPQLKADLQGRKQDDHASSENKSNGGASRGGGMGRHGHGMGGGGARGGVSAADLPKPIHLQLTVNLAKKP